MGIRDSFSRLKEKLELRSTGRRRKPDDTGPVTDGDGVEAVGSPRQVPDVVAGGHDGGGGRPNADGRQAHSRGRLSRPDTPESAPVEHGGGADIDGGEVRQSRSRLCTGFGVELGSSPIRESDGTDGEKVKQVYPPQSISSVPPNEEPEGM